MDEDEDFFDKDITIDDIDESYLQEKCDELAYECVSRVYFLLKICV